VYDPGTGSQIVDFNPGIAPSGLFWTSRLPANAIGGVNPGAGNALIQAHDVHVFDFHDGANAIFGGGPAPIPAVVSFEVRWFDVDDRVNLKNRSNGFAGEFVRNKAQMEWSGVSGDFRYVSAPMSTSFSLFAELGHERNGAYFPNA
jgi:hypothetical protein